MSLSQAVELHQFLVNSCALRFEGIACSPQRERSAPDALKESDESTRDPAVSHPLLTQQPAASKMTDDDDYLDSLRRGRLVPSRGNPPGDMNRDQAEEKVGEGIAFAAAPPEFVADIVPRPRTRANCNDSQGSRFRNHDDDDPRDRYWKKNHTVNSKEKWGTLRGLFPHITPSITELVKIKNTIYNLFIAKVVTARGDWKDKTECFLAKFEDIVPAASLQGDMTIADIGDTETPAFAFSDFELLDANLTALTRGNAPDFPQASRDRARFLRFTLTVHPRLINPGVLDIDPLEFPSQQTTTVYIRALLFNGTLTGVIAKAMLDKTPQKSLAFYAQAKVEFDICVKTCSDAAPDPENYEQWIREITAKTKFYACKQYIQKSYVGRLEGTATLAQHLVNIKQRYYDKVTQQANYRSV
jgi:hypothetical protein